MYFAFIYVSMILICKLFKIQDSKLAKLQKNSIYLILALGIIVNLILTVGLQIRKGMAL